MRKMKVIIIFFALIQTTFCDLTEEGLLSFDEKEKINDNEEKIDNVKKIDNIEYNNNEKIFKNNIIHL